MKITSAKYISGHTSLLKCPKDNKPEFAFIGRSNVGKSSLINMLTGLKDLAKVSATPGKTQLMNFFLINDTFYITDLPGFGYAKTSKGQRKIFSKMIDEYILGRENLVCLFVLIDSRVKPMESDLSFIHNLGENQVSFAIVFTKTDKLTNSALKEQLKEYKNILLQTWEELPPIFITSSRTKLGRDELLGFMEKYVRVSD